MLAMLLAKPCSPRAGNINQKSRFYIFNQWLVLAKGCSPGGQLGGELKSIENHRVMLAATTPRLTTCSPLAGDTSRPPKQYTTATGRPPPEEKEVQSCLSS